LLMTRGYRRLAGLSDAGYSSSFYHICLMTLDVRNLFLIAMMSF
jgi:hypothetical protein